MRSALGLASNDFVDPLPSTIGNLNSLVYGLYRWVTAWVFRTHVLLVVVLLLHSVPSISLGISSSLCRPTT
jgi:hypothetical protein